MMVGSCVLVSQEPGLVISSLFREEKKQETRNKKEKKKILTKSPKE